MEAGALPPAPYAPLAAGAAAAACAFADEHRLVVEPACGAALAAMYDRSLIATLSGGEGMLSSGGPIVVVVCGGSMATPALLQQWTVEAANL